MKNNDLTNVDKLINNLSTARANLEKAMEASWVDKLKMVFNQKPDVSKIIPAFEEYRKADLVASSALSHVFAKGSKEYERLLASFQEHYTYFLKVAAYLEKLGYLKNGKILV